MIIPKVIVFQSELNSFKELAEQYCIWICSRHHEQKMPSSFKRNDALARAFGYKSHSDLVNVSKGYSRPIEEKPTYSGWLGFVSIGSKAVLSHELASCFKGLTAEKIRMCLSEQALVQSNFEIIDGTPIVQCPPLPDKSHSLRGSNEIEEWWDVPFIEETRTNEGQIFYSIYVVDGGAWDRPTGKAWGMPTVEDAVKKAREMKVSNPNFRDYNTVFPDHTVYLLKEPSSSIDSIIKDVVYAVPIEMRSGLFDRIKLYVKDYQEAEFKKLISRFDRLRINISNGSEENFRVMNAFSSIHWDIKERSVLLTVSHLALYNWHNLYN